ncbi:MAG TPA: glycosyltransferase family 2 protein [Candidatus Acidoferrum sp.]|nr:glycosyltransferase family 2 protein [Candidatus Acidoferrum sp.]
MNEPDPTAHPLLQQRIEGAYLLPIRREAGGHEGELAAYLTGLPIAEIIIVDGSSTGQFDRLRDALPSGIQHVRPDPQIEGLNGKARGVLTGLQHVTHERVVIADDDVRYDENALRAIFELLDGAEVVRPQNYFDPAPWHAILDGARCLINRALDGDWPGTLAIRKSALRDGYNADVLFENLELVRTIRAGGGRERVARDLFVRRLPPTSKHYWSQRVRQAYDEFARPARLAAALSIAPLLVASILFKAPAIAGALMIAAIALALGGWLRAGSRRYFSVWCVAAAPVWILERGVCAWIAVYRRVVCGGVRYAGNVVRNAATPAGRLARPTP